jgi:hypothetical protein
LTHAGVRPTLKDNIGAAKLPSHARILAQNKIIRNKNTKTMIKSKGDKRENISNIFSCGNVRYHRQ